MFTRAKGGGPDDPPDEGRQSHRPQWLRAPGRLVGLRSGALCFATFSSPASPGQAGGPVSWHRGICSPPWPSPASASSRAHPRERESAALPLSPVGFSQVTASGQRRGRQLPGGGARPQAGRTDAVCFSLFPASCTAGNRGSVLLEVQKLPHPHGEGSYDQQIPKPSFPLDAAKAATPLRPPALPKLVTQGSLGSSSACLGASRPALVSLVG